jgi:uncharacterized membrane protein
VITVPNEKGIERVYTAFFEQPFPADLKIALLWLAASLAAIFLPGLNDSPLRFALVVPGLLFLPGYCFIALLFCGEHDIDLIERTVLSFGLSIAIVPLIGLGLNFTPWGIRLVPLVVSLTLFSLAMILAAHYRRSLLPMEERFRVPFREGLAAIRKEVAPEGGPRIERILSAVLVLAIVTTVLIAILVIAIPKQGERFTEFFILGENGKAADYPDRITPGQGYPLYIGVGNHEYRNVTYTIETWGILMESDNEKNTTRILAMDPLWQQTVTLAHNGTAIIPYTLLVDWDGYNRVEFLLFNETVPGMGGIDRINASYRDLHLWITVRGG